MSNDERLNVVLCWHMHQPEYRDLLTQEYLQPWTYLHAIKDYADMADHLEAYPGVRAVVNFVPVVLEDIDDYRDRIDKFLRTGQPLGDPLLAVLADGAIPADSDARMALAQRCTRANEQRVIGRFEPYSELVEIARACEQRGSLPSYLDGQFYLDLVVWYHLAWLGETIQRRDSRVQRLMKLERDYSADDRRELLAIVGETLTAIIPRYRRLADQGRIELSMTPYAHPMLPLLLDFESAREAMPDAPLPEAAYPGGSERVRWHIERGLESFRRFFGIRPVGCWPSEGGVSEALFPLLAEYGLQWIASGQTVLSNSLGGARIDMDDGAWPYRSYRLGESSLYGFFRDDTLSDAIGFNYSDWHGEDAAADVVNRLEHIAATLDAPQEHVVSIIMDGENAWEHYPNNGYFFLTHLYEALSDHPTLRTTTFTEFLGQHARTSRELPALCAGSWVYGTFSTWIGDPDKNRAWEVLVESKRTCDEVLHRPGLSAGLRESIERQLAICEGSDWFWWFGDYNPAESIEDFSELFRRHICNLHALMKRPVPVGLDRSFGSGGPAELGGAMRRGSA